MKDPKDPIFFNSADFTEYLPGDPDETKVSTCPDSVTTFDAELSTVTNRDITSPTPPRSSQPSLQIIEGTVTPNLAARVLDRLSEAYDQEVDNWLKDDIKIAFLTVVYANEEDREWGLDNEGDPFGPWEYAFCVYLGKHPKKLIPFFVERADKHRLLDVPDYDPTTNRLPASPKKPLKPEARLYRDCRKETA